MNKHGSILLGFIFTIMISTSVLFYFKENEMQNQMNQIKRESMIVNLDMVRYAVERAFEDPLVVSQTLHAVENQTGPVGLLSCLTDPNVICDNIEKDLVLFSPAPGKMIINPLVQSNGKFFGMSFKSLTCTLPNCSTLLMKDFACDSFTTNQADNDCVFRLKTTWKPICPAFGDCKKPKILWMLKLEANSQSQMKVVSINPQRYYVEKMF